MIQQTTWDRDSADIVLTPGNNYEEASSVFDVCVSCWCPIRSIDASAYKAMCRFLKPGGLLIETGSARENLPSLVCDDGAGLIPVFSVGDIPDFETLTVLRKF